MIVVKALSHQFSRAVHLERRAVEVVIYPALRQPLHIIPRDDSGGGHAMRGNRGSVRGCYAWPAAGGRRDHNHASVLPLRICQMPHHAATKAMPPRPSKKLKISSKPKPEF